MHTSGRTAQAIVLAGLSLAQTVIAAPHGYAVANAQGGTDSPSAATASEAAAGPFDVGWVADVSTNNASPSELEVNSRETQAVNDWANRLFETVRRINDPDLTHALNLFYEHGRTGGSRIRDIDDRQIFRPSVTPSFRWHEASSSPANRYEPVVDYYIDVDPSNPNRIRQRIRFRADALSRPENEANDLSALLEFAAIMRRYELTRNEVASVPNFNPREFADSRGPGGDKVDAMIRLADDIIYQTHIYERLSPRAQELGLTDQTNFFRIFTERRRQIENQYGTGSESVYQYRLYINSVYNDARQVGQDQLYRLRP